MEHNLHVAKAKNQELSWILISKVSDIEILINILSQLPRAGSEHSTYLVVKLTITSNHSIPQNNYSNLQPLFIPCIIQNIQRVKL